MTAIPVEVAKKNYVVTPLAIISQIPTSITADNYGFVAVTSPSGFFVVGPNGAIQEDGDRPRRYLLTTGIFLGGHPNFQRT